ncbi:MAG: iron ABC transporter permease [Treponemataceae bacterium]|nr:iron ABC transporter permease [Spirochaetales bacterium]MDY6031887.1 iron ABC transporter permease [Treponemataceae bacterium]
MKIDFNKNSKSLWTAWFAVILFFTICIVFPLFCVLFSMHASDLKAVFSQKIWLQAVKNTFLECIASSSVSVLVGYTFAYAVAKTNLPFKKFFSVVPIIHLITPPFVGGLAFILLVGRQGFITHRLLGLNISLYGFWGLLIAQVLCFFPMAYLICLQSLQSINPNLEQAAKSLGSSNLKIFFTITLPLSFPGILASFLFIAVSVLSDFGNPLIVAGRFRVLAVEIYTQLTGWLNVGTSAILGIILVVPSILLFLLQNKLYKSMNGKMATIGGKISSTYTQTNSSLAANIILTIFVVFISLCILAQLAAIVAGSFQTLWGINTTFTLKHIKAIFGYGRELKNSLGFAAISALLSTIIAVFASYIANRTNLPLKKSIDIFAQIPSAIPGSLLGLSISIAARHLHINNSPLLIIIAMTVAFLPFSYKIITSSFSQIRTTLDDQSRSLGANQIYTLAKVLCPVSTKGIYFGFIYSFIRGVGTLSAVIFLVSFNTPLTSIRIINLAEQGDWGKAAALSFVLTLVTFLILGLSLLPYKIGSKKVR